MDRVFHIRGWSAVEGRTVESYVNAADERTALDHARSLGLTEVTVTSVPYLHRSRHETDEPGGEKPRTPPPG